MSAVDISAQNFVVTILLISAISATTWIVTRHTKYAPHPPGPAGLPFIGNLALPGEPACVAYRDWGRKFKSEIVCLNVLRTNIVVLNTMKAATDLLNRRSTIYSDRPLSGLTMLLDLCGLGWSFAFLRYGSKWRDGRKLFDTEFHPPRIQRFRPVEVEQTRHFLRLLLESPEHLMRHVKYLVSAELIYITYGIQVQEHDDPWIATAERVMEAVNICLQPGAYLVDLLPFLKYAPGWMPGSRFKSQARLWRQSVMELRDKPYDLVRNTMLTNPASAVDSIAKSLIEDVESKTGDDGYMDWLARSVTGTMYVAGSDTFFLAMMLHPDVQLDAQRAIDQACPGRLPSFADYNDLPLVHAIVQETLRWKPVVPLNVPHMCTQDNIYGKYLIPGGSIVIANNWAILHDEETYPRPDEFSPYRFLKHTSDSAHPSRLTLDPDIPDPSQVAFGFGRRVCPGQFMAYEALWIAVASVLAVFNITPAKDAHGELIAASIEPEYGFSSSPRPFRCVITPRSAAHAELIVDSDTAA